MADKKLIDSITVSISTILLVLGIENFFQQWLYKYSIYMIVTGILILFLGRILIKDFQVSFLKKILTNSVGLMLLITGVDYFLEQYVAQYGILYLIVAGLLYQYYDKVSEVFA